MEAKKLKGALGDGMWKCRVCIEAPCFVDRGYMLLRVRNSACVSNGGDFMHTRNVLAVSIGANDILV